MKRNNTPGAPLITTCIMAGLNTPARPLSRHMLSLCGWFSLSLALWAAIAATALSDTVPAESKPVKPVVEHGIIGPNESTPGDLCVFNVDDGIPSSASLKWMIDPDSAKGNFDVDSSGRKAYFASSVSGRYVFFLSASIDGKAHAYKHVLVQGGMPPVPPVPPVPPDPPIPEPGKRFVMVISETGEHGEKPWISSSISGLESYAKEKGHVFRDQDPDVTNVEEKTPDWLKPFLQLVKDKKIEYPAIIIGTLKKDAEGIELEQMYAEPLPETPAKAIEILKGYGG